MIDITSERELRLKDLHPVFREADTAIAAYVDFILAKPHASDAAIQRQLTSQGVEQSVADDCIAFVPLAFGRSLVHHVGVTTSDSFIKNDLANGTQTEQPLSEQIVYTWAKCVTDLYKSSQEYHPAFKAISLRSAEVDAINNAIHSGVTEESLRESNLGPPTFFVGEPPKCWWQFWRR